ncbi:MAG: type II CAAX endopeptidase family protein [Negativicutes bacterium]|nr:type II CAAX endopeptidase family protein [Negativicutes bacterium]
MVETPVPWKLKEVLAIYSLRLLVGFFLMRVVYPGWVIAPAAAEITDRLVMVSLVWLLVHRHGSALNCWGLPGRHLLRNSLAGLAAGGVLLTVSLFSERIYTTVLLLTPSPHPLVVQAQNALTWRELAQPLLLAGLAAPVAEEVFYRLFTFSALKVRFGLWGGALGSAAIFALFHFNAYWLAELMVVGTGLALVYHWTGSLTSSIIAHSVINSTKIVLLFLKIPLS